MHRSPLRCRIWVATVYLMLTSLKGVASTKLARDLGISQKSAWHLRHRIRTTFANDRDPLMLGPIEVDETYIGGKAKNQHASQRESKRGVAGKYSVVGVLDRATGEVRAEAVDDTKRTSCRAIWKRMSRPMRPRNLMRCAATRIYHNRMKRCGAVAVYMFVGRSKPIVLSRSRRCRSVVT